MSTLNTCSNSVSTFSQKQNKLTYLFEMLIVLLVSNLLTMACAHAT